MKHKMKNVPGKTDTVPALLSPGEAVVNQKANTPVHQKQIQKWNKQGLSKHAAQAPMPMAMQQQVMQQPPVGMCAGGMVHGYASGVSNVPNQSGVIDTTLGANNGSLRDIAARTKYPEAYQALPENANVTHGFDPQVNPGSRSTLPPYQPNFETQTGPYSKIPPRSTIPSGNEVAPFKPAGLPEAQGQPRYGIPNNNFTVEGGGLKGAVNRTGTALQPAGPLQKGAYQPNWTIPPEHIDIQAVQEPPKQSMFEQTAQGQMDASRAAANQRVRDAAAASRSAVPNETIVNDNFNNPASSANTASSTQSDPWTDRSAPAASGGNGIGSKVVRGLGGIAKGFAAGELLNAGQRAAYNYLPKTMATNAIAAGMQYLGGDTNTAAQMLAGQPVDSMSPEARGVVSGSYGGKLGSWMAEDGFDPNTNTQKPDAVAQKVLSNTIESKPTMEDPVLNGRQLAPIDFSHPTIQSKRGLAGSAINTNGNQTRVDLGGDNFISANTNAAGTAQGAIHNQNAAATGAQRVYDGIQQRGGLAGVASGISGSGNSDFWKNRGYEGGQSQYLQEQKDNAEKEQMASEHRQLMNLAFSTPDTGAELGVWAAQKHSKKAALEMLGHDAENQRHASGLAAAAKQAAYQRDVGLATASATQNDRNLTHQETMAKQRLEAAKPIVAGGGQEYSEKADKVLNKPQSIFQYDPLTGQYNEKIDPVRAQMESPQYRATFAQLRAKYPKATDEDIHAAMQSNPNQR